MRDVQLGPTEWEATLTHDRCGTRFTAEANDLQVDHFKQPGTYWFDGSADAAGLAIRFFVECPHGDDIVFVETDTVPARLRDRLVEELDGA